MTAKLKTIDRVLNIIIDMSLSPQGVAILELVQRYHVSRRTIDRDIAMIANAGFQIETLTSSSTAAVRKRIIPSIPLYQMVVSDEEYACAKKCVELLKNNGHDDYAGKLQNLISRLWPTDHHRDHLPFKILPAIGSEIINQS